MVFADDELFYERELPHYQPRDTTYSGVFRIAGSLPADVVAALQSERGEFRRGLSGMDKRRRKEWFRKYSLERFMKFDSLLDHESTGPRWLKDSRIAEIVVKAMHHWDEKAYELLAYCIMPNHVHMVLSTGAASTIYLPEFPLKGPTPYHLTNILTSIKKYSALRANRLLYRSGPFWQDESYDHVVRDEKELERTIWYVLENPVKAGLIREGREWQWSYAKVGLV